MPAIYDVMYSTGYVETQKKELQGLYLLEILWKYKIRDFLKPFLSTRMGFVCGFKVDQERKLKRRTRV